MKINSEQVDVTATDQKIFSLVSNCSHFGKFLPEQVNDWEATDEYCKFSFQGLVTLTLRIVEKTEFSKVVFQAENSHNIPVFFIIYIEGNGDESKVKVEANMDIPIYLSGMVKKPLQTFVDMTAEKIKIEGEK